MMFESEVPVVLCAGFGLVTLAALAALVVFLVRSRNMGLLYFVAQLVFLALAFFCFYQILEVPKTAMYTEDCSAWIGSAGLSWGVSMLSMLLGIRRLLKKEKVIHQF